MILLIASLVSAIFVVTTAHRTRLLTAEREQLVLERDALDIEWRNLILEENASAITAGLNVSRQKNCRCNTLIHRRKISSLNNEWFNRNNDTE